ncbi:DUF2076 domain-containing protein [Methylocystis sp. MJC1]|jgi:hypothetical protein|uniref:DUF2076 domain-containing protein n=1 Tax=Methylocystis sp. MJC1 TaxID=2654282 RepID=UPI0013EC680E|nr:DUF2076 domain-containing protein [Methylocystis sp. MJC1]KAF2992254.1 hypothetical protein MJC1_00632 [Methylocystis sp. MJC1]MBU6527394.1 DUF2076 domain-containing protein [Methylocystis sp. MJC1]UZX10344.1 DUF2076 domain-containing protein [Methylocystis sp. MJC1]
MSPEERQLLVGLFERTKSAANGPRDQEAETFISEQIKQQPAAPYLLAQTVIVQDQALQGANARIQALEAQVKELQSKPAGGFLGGLFGGGQQRQAPPPSPAAPSGPWGAPPQGGRNPVAGGYAPQGWGQQQPAAPSGSGNSFLHGALGTAAGVAGGVLLADGIRSLFSHGSGAGGMANLGIGSGFTPTGETTVINNYYGDEPGAPGAYDANYDQGYDDSGNVSDAGYSSDPGYDDGGSFDDDGGDGGFDV